MFSEKLTLASCCSSLHFLPFQKTRSLPWLGNKSSTYYQFCSFVVQNLDRYADDAINFHFHIFITKEIHRKMLCCSSSFWESHGSFSCNSGLFLGCPNSLIPHLLFHSLILEVSCPILIWWSMILGIMETLSFSEKQNKTKEKMKQKQTKQKHFPPQTKRKTLGGTTLYLPGHSLIHRT